MNRLIHCNVAGSHSTGKGRILVVLNDNSIIVQCKTNRCRRWIKLSFSFPGINLDFSKAAITKEFLPENYRFNETEAPHMKEASCV